MIFFWLWFASCGVGIIAACIFLSWLGNSWGYRHTLKTVFSPRT